jgi:hypothetical protein
MPACAGMTVAGWFEIELAGKADFAIEIAYHTPREGPALPEVVFRHSPKAARMNR